MSKPIYIYVPDSHNLEAVVADRPRNLWGYEDYVWYFISLMCWSFLSYDDDGDDDGFVRLKGVTVKKVIPRVVFCNIKKFLVDTNVVEISEYIAKKRCTGYRLSADYIGPPRRIKIVDADLCRKHEDSYDFAAQPKPSKALIHVIERRKPIVDGVRASIFKMGFADHHEVYRAALNADKDPLTSWYAYWSIETIRLHDNGKIITDPFGQRLHSQSSRTSKHIRRFIQIDGQDTIETDVSSMQPLMLCLLFPSGKKLKIFNSQLPIYMCTKIHERFVQNTKPSVLEKYQQCCEQGIFNSVMLARLPGYDKGTMKKALFHEVFFGGVNVTGPVQDAFKREFPGIYDVLLLIKKRYGYKSIARMLQRAESELMIDGVCGTLVEDHPEVSFLPVHDSLVTPEIHRATVQGVMHDQFDRRGLRCSMHN